MLRSTVPLVLIDACPITGPAAYGKRKFVEVLKHLGCQIAMGKDSDPVGSQKRVYIGLIDDPLLQTIINHTSSAPEGVIIRNISSKNTLVISGTDARGLMYALLEICQHLEAEGLSGFDTIENIDEFPENCVRGVDRYIMGHLDNTWFFSESFWQYFLSRLAVNRFNRFVLIMGFDTAYLTPPYPFFVNVPGFSDVRAVSDGERQKNLTQLRHIGSICHDYGLEYFLGTWQQTPWTPVQKDMVKNLPLEGYGLAEYCANGTTALLNACDTADGIQLRVNLESGVGTQISNDDFWMRVVDGVSAVSRPIKLAIRAKGMSDSLLAYARGTGLRFEVRDKTLV